MFGFKKKNIIEDFVDKHLNFCNTLSEIHQDRIIKAHKNYKENSFKNFDPVKFQILVGSQIEYILDHNDIETAKEKIRGFISELAEEIEKKIKY